MWFVCEDNDENKLCRRQIDTTTRMIDAWFAGVAAGTGACQNAMLAFINSRAKATREHKRAEWTFVSLCVTSWSQWMAGKLLKQRMLQKCPRLINSFACTGPYGSSLLVHNLSIVFLSPVPSVPYCPLFLFLRLQQVKDSLTLQLTQQQSRVLGMLLLKDVYLFFILRSSFFPCRFVADPTQ